MIGLRKANRREKKDFPNAVATITIGNHEAQLTQKDISLLHSKLNEIDIDSVRQRNFLKELTDLCRKHRLEVSIDCHSVELALFDIDEFKNKNPDSANLDDNEYYLNGNYSNFQYEPK